MKVVWMVEARDDVLLHAKGGVGCGLVLQRDCVLPSLLPSLP